MDEMYMDWITCWYAAAAFVGAMWAVRLVAIGWTLKNRQPLSSSSYSGPPSPAPRMSVIVAAKDEEQNIETCITTLLDQDYPDYQIIAVNDRSSDRTLAILHRLQKQHPNRLRVVNITALREGWFGKNNAMREGVALSDTDWFCFTDADCRQTSRSTLSMAMNEALATDCDFLSVTPVLETKTVWERIIQPVCAAVLIIWFLPSRVNNPRTKTAYANGAFMLMRRSCYDAIGGHDRVKTEVNEDIHMARFTKEAGLKLRVTENEDLYKTRMYATPWEAWRGWSRIFYGSLASAPRVLLAIGFLSVFTILPWVSLTGAAYGWITTNAAESGMWRNLSVVWVVVVLLQQMVMWRMYGILRIFRPWSFTYILGGAIALAMLVNALLKVLGAGKTTWRGTVYQGDQVTGSVQVASPPVVISAAEPAPVETASVETAPADTAPVEEASPNV